MFIKYLKYNDRYIHIKIIIIINYKNDLSKNHGKDDK